MDGVLLAVTVTGMSAVFCLVAGLTYSFCRREIGEKARIKSVLGEPEKKPTGLLRRKKKTEGNEKPRPKLDKLRDELYVADIALRAEEFITIWAMLTMAVPVLAMFFGAQPVICFAIAAIGAFMPIFYVKLKRKRRLAKFEKQLLDAIAILCNSLRAGLSFQTALKSISEEMEEPISREFGRVYKETRMGMPLETSLNRLVERTENRDLELVCSAVMIQRQIGGNLAVILENICSTIDERIKLRGEIKTLTASGTMSGYIIGALPIFMLVMMAFVNPGYINMFFSTSVGNIMLAVSVVMELIGFMMVRKIVNIKM